MKLPEKPHANASIHEKNDYYRKLTEFSEFEREKNEAYYESRIDKLNAAIILTLVVLASTVGFIVWLLINK